MAKKAEKLNVSNIKILLVEDDEFLRNICETKLKKEGFNVSIATSGNEALKKIIEEDPPQLILLDIILPKISGFEILKFIKNDPIKSSILVVVLSNLGQAEEIKKGLDLGAEDYIIKAHFTVGEIVEKVKNVLKEKNII